MICGIGGLFGIAVGYIGTLIVGKASFDLILLPAAPSVAPRLGESLSDPLQMYLSDVYTVTANLAGLPCASFPCGEEEQTGLPVGAQLLARRDEEGLLLRAVDAFQRHTDYHLHRGGMAR